MWLVGLLLMLQAPSPDPYLLWKSDRYVPAGPWPVTVVAPVFPDGPGTLEKAEIVVPLDVEADATGRVSRAVVIGDAQGPFAMSALSALMRWRFEQGTAASRPVRVVVTYRTMPAGTSADQLTAIFRNKFEVEVRKASGAR